MQKYLVATRIAALLCAMSPWSSCVYAATITAKPALITDFADGGFEQPAIGAAAIVVNPVSTEWTFAGSGVGYASNGSGFGNPTAPNGTQVLYIQGSTGSTTQSFHAATGRYRVTLKATQRHLWPGNNQTVLVTVDNGAPVAITPTTAFADYAFDIDLAGGTHTLKLSGQAIGDHTAFVDGVALAPIGYVANGSFEAPAIGTAAIVPAPSGSGWSFSVQSAGFASNGSGFGNANAPTGTQVLYIQGGATYASRTVNTSTSTRYRLAFKAAQRPTNTQTVLVTIDGIDVGRVTPASNAFETFDFDGLLLTAGPHELKFIGQNSVGDNTAFIDDVTLMPVVASARRWSDPGTWDLGRIPADGDDVAIPANSVVLLDPNPAEPPALPVANSIGVQGDLLCDDANIKLATKSIMVTGRFTCGSRFTPYMETFVLTLAGSELPTSGAGMGDKVFGAMGSGVVDIHGEPRTSWTQIASNLSIGATQMTLAAPTNWRSGDRIVIAPTGYEYINNESDVVTITQVSGNGTIVQFTPPLAYKHYGGQSTYTNGRTTWTLDERAEVGLLTRNIKIQGDAASASTRFGGHMMSMRGTTVRASNIELFRMGQKKLLARYPFHWHKVGDAPNQYIENSSVHESYNRCITVHRTNKVRVAGNVCYDFIGHGYFLEDGNERFNTFDRNLGIYAKKPLYNPGANPPIDDAILETDRRDSGASNGPAVFWISNPTNTVTNNVAAGSQGSGFWYHTESVAVPADPDRPAGLPPEYLPVPATEPFLVFDNNRAHTARQGATMCRDPSNAFGLESPDALFTRLTVSQVVQGIWPCGTKRAVNATFDETIVANSENGMQAPSSVVFANSLFVAYSANEPEQSKPESERAWNAIMMYDQGLILDRVRFVNYDRPNMSVFLATGSALKQAGNQTRRLSFENSPNVFLDLNDNWAPGNPPTYWGEAVLDLDGTLVGTAGHSMTSHHPLTNDAQCVRPSNSAFRGFACPYRYAQFRLAAKLGPGESFGADQVTVLRSDGVTETSSHEPFRHFFLHQYMVTAPYRYAYRYDAGNPRHSVTFVTDWANQGDTSIHELLDVPGGYSVTQPPGATWTEVFSLQALSAGNGREYYYHADAKSLFVKLRAEGPERYATDSVEVCMTARASGECPAGARVPDVPSVAITSPSRTSSGTFVVGGTASHAAGIAWVRLFVDDVQIGQLNSAPYNFNVTRNPGTYRLKFVAQAAGTNGESYTAIQTLVVGTPPMDLAITSPADNTTIDASLAAASRPMLTYTATAPATPSGMHLHLIDNDVDLGDVTTAKLQLSQFAQGRHDIQLAWARADHTVVGRTERRTVYVARSGVLVDFEDGIDRRVSMHANGVNIRPAVWYYRGLRSTARIPNELVADDRMHFDVLDTSGQPGPITARINLAPDQDWSTYSNLRISHAGAGMSVYLRYSNRSPQYVGALQETGYLYETLSLAGVPKDNVVGIDLVQHAPPPWSTTQWLTEIQLQ